MAERPELGKPSLHLRARRLHGEHVSVLRRGDGRPEVRRDARGDRRAAGAQHRAAARVLPQPDRRRPRRRPVGEADRRDRGARAAAVRRHGVPGLRRGPRRGCVRGARAGPPRRADARRELVLEELLAVWRARGRVERRLRRRGRGRARARPAGRRRALELQQSADLRRESRRGRARHAGAAQAVGRGTGGDVPPHRADAPVDPRRPARPRERRSAHALREAARDVHVHGPDRIAGRRAARGARRVHPALGPDVRGGPERLERRHRRGRDRQGAEERRLTAAPRRRGAPRCTTGCVPSREQPVFCWASIMCGARLTHGQARRYDHGIACTTEERHGHPDHPARHAARGRRRAADRHGAAAAARCAEGGIRVAQLL
ncbi:hypothetical protein F01_450008 [Burkholderia cenocepacia]|nr:hypothetical protein F01_450008 [Burkholderia cenocepacia]